MSEGRGGAGNPGVPKVYLALHAVMAALGEAGIGKDNTNKQQGFKFRGVDQVYAALNPLLVKHNLLMLPRMTRHETTERKTKSGGAIFATVVLVEYDFISVEDGSKHTISGYGEGMDSADKSTSKAASIAYKYSVFQAFSIPVEGAMPDPDADSHEEVEGNADTIRRLLKLMEDNGCKEETICKAYGVEVLEDLSSKVYGEVETRIVNFGKNRESRRTQK